MHPVITHTMAAIAGGSVTLITFSLLVAGSRRRGGGL